MILNNEQMHYNSNINKRDNIKKKLPEKDKKLTNRLINMLAK